jgi:hypothetical protein
LARRGLNYLRGTGVSLSQRFHPSEQRELSHWFLSHTLAVNSVLISLDLVSRQRPEQFALASILHERELRREPSYVRGADGRRVAVIPDAWVDLGIGGRYRMCLSLEVDRGTEEQKKWRSKVAALLTWAQGPYRERFDTDSLTVAVIATPGTARMEELLRWTEAELTLRKANPQADLFRFTDIDAESAAPEHLVNGPCWHVPFGKGEVLPLVPGTLLPGL